MFVPNARRLSRRRFVSLAASGAAGLIVRQTGLAATTDISIKAPYFHQGSTGYESAVNCGPTAVCMAINYSGAAYPAVANVRATLGLSGPTDVDQWAWLLDVYGVPWYPTWSQEQVAASLRKGHPVVIGTWMGTLIRRRRLRGGLRRERRLARAVRQLLRGPRDGDRRPRG